METLEVNGHVANDTKGTIFCKGGKYFEVTREVFDEVMSILIKDKKLVISDKLTLIY